MRRFLICLLATVSSAALRAETAGVYTLRLGEDLARLSVEARFERHVPSLAARSREAGSLLTTATDCERQRPLVVRGRELMIPAAGVRCVDYTVDLGSAVADERRNRQLAAGSVIVSPSKWLWRPSLDGDSELRLRFLLPDGVGVALPFAEVTGNRNEYRLSASPESGSAPAVFGRFGDHEIEVGGARARIVLPDSRPGLDPAAVIPWLRAAATDVSLAYGRFPNPRVFVVVLPVAADRRWSASPVPFGRVVRDGGEAVELFVDPSRPLADYLVDWTATHEFSHLMLPYVERDARWLSEGFAQYYQNVLMARSGAHDAATAWQKIVAGLARGRASRPELSPNDAALRGRRGARMKVYWAGAALALIADVTLRERSAGRESLDTVLAGLQACCLPSARVWSGPELLARLDALAGDAVFMPLYRQHADQAGFPDVSAVLASLGVVDAGGGRIRLAADAPLSAHRRRIMQADAAVAAWRRGLAAD